MPKISKISSLNSDEPIDIELWLRWIELRYIDLERLRAKKTNGAPLKFIPDKSIWFNFLAFFIKLLIFRTKFSELNLSFSEPSSIVRVL